MAKDNFTSPKGDGTMGDENTATAASHNPDGVSTVPKDPAAAEKAFQKGAKQAEPAAPANDGN